MRILLLLLLCVSSTFAQVTYERLLRAEAEPGNWLTYSGNYQAHRYAPLAEINTTNVARLKPAWVYQIRDPGKVESTPLVVDGTLYITEKPYVVTALDGRTGRPIWTYRRTHPPTWGLAARGYAEKARIHLRVQGTRPPRCSPLRCLRVRGQGLLVRTGADRAGRSPR